MVNVLSKVTDNSSVIINLISSRKQNEIVTRFKSAGYSSSEEAFLEIKYKAAVCLNCKTRKVNILNTQALNYR